MLNSADNHQTKPSMKYEIYNIWNMKYIIHEIYHIYQIKYEIYQKLNISNRIKGN